MLNTSDLVLKNVKSNLTYSLNFLFDKSRG